MASLEIRGHDVNTQTYEEMNNALNNRRTGEFELSGWEKTNGKVGGRHLYQGYDHAAYITNVGNRKLDVAEESHNLEP